MATSPESAGVCAPVCESNRKLACRSASSGPWQVKHLLERIERTSRLKSIDGLAGSSASESWHVATTATVSNNPILERLIDLVPLLEVGVGAGKCRPDQANRSFGSLSMWIRSVASGAGSLRSLFRPSLLRVQQTATGDRGHAWHTSPSSTPSAHGTPLSSR